VSEGARGEAIGASPAHLGDGTTLEVKSAEILARGAALGSSLA
jgi:hypothetical protein